MYNVPGPVSVIVEDLDLLGPKMNNHPLKHEQTLTSNQSDDGQFNRDLL